MTEEASTRILNRLERILEAIEDVNPIEIADHVSSDSMKAWTKSLRDYVYARVGEIEDEVKKVVE